MSLRIRRKSPVSVKLASTLIAIFALVVAPMYGVVESRVANAVSITAYSENFNSGTGNFNTGGGAYGSIANDGGMAVVDAGTGGYGPYSWLDQHPGSGSTWTGDYQTSIDVYLDTDWANGSGFEWDVASASTTSSHRRDFIAHVVKDTSTGQLLFSASNNTNYSPKQNLENGNHYVVNTSGWYKIQHSFHNNAGVLAVDISLLDSTGAVLYTVTRTTSTDLIPSVVGAHSYAWFTNVAVTGGLKVDNVSLIQELPDPEIHSVRFSTMSKDKGASYDGVVVDSYMRDFSDVTSVKVEIEREDGSKVFRRGNHLTRDHISQGGNRALTTPFSFEGNSGNAWWAPQQGGEWTKATRPVRVTITVNTANQGKKVFSTPIDQGLVVKNGTYSSLISPSTPTNLHRVAKNSGYILPCGAVTIRQVLFPSWNEYADNEDIDYFNYKTSNGYTTTVPDSSFDTHNSMPSADGANAFRVQAVDIYGNVSEWSDWCEVTYDNTTPEATLSVDSVINPTELTVGINDTNPQGSYATNIYNLAKNSIEVNTCDGSFAPGATTATCAISLSGLADGEYWVKANVVDEAGNNSASVASNIGWVKVTVDNTPPVVTMDAVTGPVSGILTLTGTASDAGTGLRALNSGSGSASEGQLVRVSLWLLNEDGTLNSQVKTYKATDFNGDNWTLTVNTKDLPDGNYRIVARANDNTGNSFATSNTAVAKDSDGSYPTIRIDNPDNDENTEPAVSELIVNNEDTSDTDPDERANRNRSLPNQRSTGFTLPLGAQGTSVLGLGIDNGDEGANSPFNTFSQGDQKKILGAEDENDNTGCFKLLGLCWYWWIPIIVVVAALITWWGVSRRGKQA